MEALGEHIAELYRNRLWHELGVELLNFEGDLLWNAWSWIETFANRLNQVVLVKLAISASKSRSIQEALTFSGKVTATEPQAALLLRTFRARLTLAFGDMSGAFSDLD